MTKEPGLEGSDTNVISDKFKNRKGGRKNRNGEESNHEEERQKKKKMIEDVNIINCVLYIPQKLRIILLRCS